MKNTVRRDSSFIAHGAFESFESIKDLDRLRNAVALTLLACRVEEKSMSEEIRQRCFIHDEKRLRRDGEQLGRTFFNRH